MNCIEIVCCRRQDMGKQEVFAARLCAPRLRALRSRGRRGRGRVGSSASAAERTFLLRHMPCLVHASDAKIITGPRVGPLWG